MCHAILTVNPKTQIEERSSFVAIDVRSPTTGVVIEVKVAVGDRVVTDDELVTIESMKMHIPVASPADGSVQSLRVAQGDHVSEDDIIATIA